MHQYGKSLVLEDVTDGKVLWRVEPKTDAEGNIESVPLGSFWKKGGVPMRSDHVYRLTVTYDNPTGQPPCGRVRRGTAPTRPPGAASGGITRSRAARMRWFPVWLWGGCGGK